MIRLRTPLAIAVASALVAACASNGGNGASAPAGYPESYSRQQADIQQLAASRFDRQTIIQAQQALGEKGHDVGPIDGIWGPSSQAALENFQRMNGMTADGRLDAETLDKLGVSNARVAGQAGATDGTTAAAAGNRDLDAFYDTRTILAVQRILADRGFEVGRVDGVWGPESQSALRAFQQNEGLQATGRINAPTLAALDLPSGSAETQRAIRR